MINFNWHVKKRTGRKKTKKVGVFATAFTCKEKKQRFYYVIITSNLSYSSHNYFKGILLELHPLSRHIKVGGGL